MMNSDLKKLLEKHAEEIKSLSKILAGYSMEIIFTELKAADVSEIHEETILDLGITCMFILRTLAKAFGKFAEHEVENAFTDIKLTNKFYKDFLGERKNDR